MIGFPYNPDNCVILSNQVRNANQFNTNVPNGANNPPHILLWDFVDNKVQWVNSITNLIEQELGSGGTPFIPCIDVTWAELNLMATNSLLIECQQYHITDFRTRENIPNTADVHLGVVEPIVVTADSVNTLSGLARSTVYHNDTLIYELNDSTSQGGDMGRISYRKDESLNISSWYDWRNVVFRRWRPFEGINYVLITPTSLTDVFQDFYTFNPNALNDLVVYDVVIGQSFNSKVSILPNTIFQGNADPVIGSSFGYGVLDNTFLRECSQSKFGDYCTENTITGNWQSNIVGDYFSGNTLARSYSNKIGNEFSDNIISQGFDYNTIQNAFLQNEILTNFYDNTIGNQFQYNTIASGFIGNTIQLGFQDNVIGTNFQDNDISNWFYSNIIGNNFGRNPFNFPSILGGNVIAAYFHGNTIGINFVNNMIGTNFYQNVTGENFNQNKTAPFCYQNEFNANFIQNNDLGSYFRNNYIGALASFGNNIFGTECYSNRIESAFIQNKIGNAFRQNGDMLTPLGNFTGNVILQSFIGNTIPLDFNYNYIRGEFSSCVLSSLVSQLETKTDVFSFDFTLSTLIYGAGNKEVIKANSGNEYITYFNGVSQQYVTPITT